MYFIIYYLKKQRNYKSQIFLHDTVYITNIGVT